MPERLNAASGYIYIIYIYIYISVHLVGSTGNENDTLTANKT